MRFVSPLIALSLLACSTSKQQPPVPPPQVDYVYLYPSFVRLFPRASQQFDAQVIGNGASRSALRLYVNGIEGGSASVGTITSAGAYTAPSVPPIPNQVALSAVSVDDPSKTASAQIELLLPPGSVTIAVGPDAVELPNGGRQRFSATVSGTADTRVTWSAGQASVGRLEPVGTVDESGVYTAPSSGFCKDAVTATSVVDPTAKASATVRCIPEAPAIASISPDHANPGEFITITGTSFYYDVELRVVFTGTDGVPITAVAPAFSGPTRIILPVPAGTATGPVSVEGVFDSRTLRSNAVTFTRTPRLRVVPSARELAAGESTLVHGRIVAGAAPEGIAWSAEAGTISPSGVYTGPADVTSATIVKITGCVIGTEVCQSTRVRVRSLRVDPFRAVVSLGETVHLSAVRGGSTLAPAWNLWGPAGTLLDSGDYTAGTRPVDGGAIAVHASASGIEETSWVAVTGGFPGEVARLYDFFSPADRRSDYADSATAAGNRLYVVFAEDVQPANSQERFFLDVYDLSDVARPVWVDSIEPMMRPEDMWVDGGRLFLLNSRNRFVDGQPAVAIYDVGGDTPILTAYRRTDAASEPGPRLAANISRDGNSLFWCTHYSAGDAAAQCAELDIPTSIRKNYRLPVPAGLPFAASMGMTRVGDRIYLAFDDPGPPFQLFTYDASVDPPALLHTAHLPQPPSFNAFGAAISAANPLTRGPTMVIGNYVFDISGGSAVLRSIIPCPIVLDWAGKYLVGLGPVSGELRVFDLSDPANPVWLGAFPAEAAEADVFIGQRARLWGDRLLLPAGSRGLALYRIAEPGGFHERQMTGDAGSAVFEQVVRDGLLYSPEAFGNGGLLVIWDVSSPPAKALSKVPLGAELPLTTVLHGNLLYVGTDRALRLFNVSVPARPSPLASLPQPTVALAISGTSLFASTVLSDGTLGLAVMDIADPSVPRKVAELPLPGSIVKFALAGSTLYAAAESAGLLVIDIAQPSAPKLLAQWQPSPFVEDVALDGNLALIAAFDRGLLLADVTVPSAPVEISETTLPRWASHLTGDPVGRPEVVSVALRRGYVYLGTFNDFGRVYAFDYRNTLHPRPVSVTRAPGFFADSFVATFAFTADEVFYAGFNDDPDGFLSPGSEATDLQPGNLILMHPQVLESMVSTTSAAGPTAGAVSSLAALPPMHPKLRRLAGMRPVAR